jgi:hypothetical protein
VKNVVFQTSRPALGPTHPFITGIWISRDLSLSINRPGRLSDPLPPYGSKIMNEGIEASTPVRGQFYFTFKV